MEAWLESDLVLPDLYYLHYTKPEWDPQSMEWCAGEGRFISPVEIEKLGINLKPGECVEVKYTCRTVGKVMKPPEVKS